MTRPSTELRDRRILRLYQQGVDPKSIRIRLQLQNIWIVYGALRRARGPKAAR